MNEHSGSSFSVLLPAARVGLFVLDQDTRDAAKALQDDWRFARVVFEINEGDVEAAIASYQNRESPDLVLVETSTIEEGFSSRLEVLAGNCSAGTAAVVIGPVNDVYLYRKLIDMGVTDYLVRPLQKEMIAEVIIKTLIERLGNPGSRLVAFVGAKGGVGTSSIAHACAVLASSKLEQKTTILDAAGGWTYLPVAMGMEPLTTLNEASRACGSSDQDSLKRMIGAVSDKLSVLATGAEGLLDETVSPEAFETILSRLMTTSPLVVVDLSAAPVGIRKATLIRAHEVVIVSTPSLPSLRTARALLQEIKTLRGGSDQDVELVINKVGEAAGLEVSAAEIQGAMGRKPTLSIAFSPKIFAGMEAQGKKITDLPEAGDVVSSLLDLLRKLLRVEGLKDAVDNKKTSGSEGMLGNLLGMFKAK